MVGIPPIRRYFGDVDPEPIPLSYPSMSPTPNAPGLGILTGLAVSRLVNVILLC